MYVDMGGKNLFVKAKAGKHNSVGKNKSGFLWGVTKGALEGGSPGAHFGGRH